MQKKDTDTLTTGIVYKKTLGHYDVRHDDKTTTCTPSARLWKSFDIGKASNHDQQRVTHVSEKHMDPVAIGDRVTFIPAGDGTGMIQEILPRRNYLARASAKPKPGAHTFEQVIAANLDQVIPVFAVAEPQPKWPMLDRYLVTAEVYGLPSKIMLTKYDLVQDRDSEEELHLALERYQKIGYPVILTSVRNMMGLEACLNALTGQISVLVGKSGVGKTTLLNALEPGLGLRVQDVSQTTGKGRHTTTYLEMFPLAAGGAIIDTPGMREFGIWGLSSGDIADYFPEMRPLLGQCKFGLNCRHDQEPDCAIRQGVMDGAISPYRYKSYLRLRVDM